MALLLTWIGSIDVLAIIPWLDPLDAAYVIVEQPKIVYSPYDWGLGCSVA